MTIHRKYDIQAVRNAIQAVGASPAAIAEYLGCARSTVYAYLRKYPALQDEFESRRGLEVGERPQFPREKFAAAILGSHGVKAAVAAAVGCSRQTVDNALQRWPELAEMLDAERSTLVTMAVSALATDVRNPESDGHQRAYMFVLRTLGKDEGFSERQEITGADGEALLELPADVVAAMRAMGLDMQAVSRHLAQMVRSQASQKGIPTP